MNLSKAVERFTLETLSDPYGVGGTIKGHLSVFDGEKSSGPTSRRRTIETLPTYTMFSTNCVSHAAGVFIVGAPSYDFHKGTVVRAKYTAIPCDDQFKIASINQILTDTVTTRVSYISIDQYKSSVADSETSYAVTEYTAYMPDLESIGKGNVLITGSTYYKVKSDPWIDGAGFKNVSVILLTSPLRTSVFTQTSGFNPVTETMVAGTTYTSTKMFVEDAYYCYEHTSERYSQLEPGDKNITFKPSVVPKAGDIVDVYKILTVDAVSDGTYSCHCRKV